MQCNGAGERCVAYRRITLLLALVFTCRVIMAEQFVVFPERRELYSPDGRFVLRSIEHAGAAGEFSGIFRSLVLEEVATGATQTIYNYVGRVGAAWSGNDFVIVNDYAGKKTARALLFRLDRRNEYLIIDKPYLTAQLHERRREQLEGNDHVYLEVSRIEGSALLLRVWGYGKLDPQGFRFWCTYDLNEGTVSCRENLREGNNGSSTGA